MKPKWKTLQAEREAGYQRGRTLGFPTINLPLPSGLMGEEEYGVYAGIIEIRGEAYWAIMNIGSRPSFELPEPLIEAYVLESVVQVGVGEECTLHVLMDRIRTLQNFASGEELKDQISRDLSRAHALLAREASRRT